MNVFFKIFEIFVKAVYEFLKFLQTLLVKEISWKSLTRIVNDESKFRVRQIFKFRFQITQSKIKLFYIIFYTTITSFSATYLVE